MGNAGIHSNINTFIGQRIKELRVNLGISQKDLGKLLGVTYQQAHKYECGTNRISASSLVVLAQKMNIPVSYFFEGLMTTGTQGSKTEDDTSNPHQRLNLELAKNFRKIHNTRHQEAINQLVRTLAD